MTGKLDQTFVLSLQQFYSFKPAF